jgi:16S rRNA (guanine527-N7)-methyltransferase
MIRQSPEAGPAPDLTRDRASALALTPIAPEIVGRLDRFVELLLERQQKQNLIAASTIPIIWTRHIADSLQLMALAPGARTWIDLGSGAGFPGLVLACALADTPGAVVHLVESTKKKAAFLDETARLIGAPAIVHAVRIEDFVKKFSGAPDVITARALAPLEVLLDLARPWFEKGAQGLFPKGQDVESELTQATKYWNIEAVLVPSKPNPQSRIVVVRSARRRQIKRQG